MFVTPYALVTVKEKSDMRLTIPSNSTARVYVPKGGFKEITVTESGLLLWQDSEFVPGVAGIDAGRENGDYITFEVGSREHFTYPKNVPKKFHRYPIVTTTSTSEI